MSDGEGTGEGGGGIPAGVATVVGHPGAGVNAWGATKKDARGKYVRCVYPAQDGVVAQEWPLSELTLKTLVGRWGYGDFRLAWFINDPDNEDVARRRRSGGSGVPFTLQAPESVTAVVEAPPAPIPQAPPPPVGSLEHSLHLMNLFDQRSTSQLASIVQVAGVMAGRNSGGIDGATVLALLERSDARAREQTEAFERRHQESMTVLRAEIATLRSEVTDDDDEDDDGPAATVVRAAAPLFRPGQPIGDGLTAALGNYVAQNPGVVFELLKSVPGVIEKLSKMAGTPPASPAPVPVQALPQRPRAVPAVRSVPTPKEEAQALNSLNSMPSPPPPVSEVVPASPS